MKQGKDVGVRYLRRKIIKSIGLDNVPTMMGAEKTCYVFNVFVVCSESIPNEDFDISSYMMQKIIKHKNLNYLANAGIKTPRIIDIFFEKGHIFEVQERAPGDVLSYTNETNILNTFCKDKKYVSIRDMSEYLRNDFCKQVLDYNFNMQKKLKSAPISHYVEFIKGFKSILEYGLDIDVHGENFLYDVDKGFSFIDLPATQSTEKKKFSPENVEDLKFSVDTKKVKTIEKFRKVDDYSFFKQICSLFVDFLKYSPYVFDDKLVKQMKKNNFAIIKNKLIPAAKMAGLIMTENEQNRLKNYIQEFVYTKKSDLEIDLKPTI